MSHTSKEFIKFRLDNFSMGFLLFYVNLSIAKINKSHKYAGTAVLIKKLKICSIPLSESEEYDILKIIPMSLYIWT